MIFFFLAHFTRAQGGCVRDTNSARWGRGWCGVCVHSDTALRHTTSPHVAILAETNSLSFCRLALRLSLDVSLHVQSGNVKYDVGTINTPEGF